MKKEGEERKKRSGEIGEKLTGVEAERYVTTGKETLPPDGKTEQL